MFTATREFYNFYSKKQLLLFMQEVFSSRFFIYFHILEANVGYFTPLLLFASFSYFSDFRILMQNIDELIHLNVL